MPGLLLPSQIGSRVKPPFGSSPVEDDPLFGEAGTDKFDPPVQVPEDDGWHFSDDPIDPNDTLQPEPGVNSMDEAEADRIARDPRFNTVLTPEEEPGFEAWKQQNFPNDSGYDYDLKGAYKAGMQPDPETGHGLDTFKKPNHPTFSDQSQYAQIMPEKAGRWDEAGKYVPAGVDSDWYFGDETHAEAPVDVTGDPSSNAYGFGGRGDTLVERMKDRFYTGPDYNIAMNMVAHSGDIMEGIGALIEGYGTDTFVSEIGAKARAAGQSIGGYIRDKMDPEWVKAQQKSYLDFSENGALRDPKAFVMGITGQIPTIASTLGLGSAAGAGLEILGLSAPVATVGGLMVGGAVSTGGDAASSAADAIDAANLSPEQRTKAERIAATAAIPMGLAVGPFYAKLFGGGFGGLFGSLAATGVEEFTEEAGTEAAAQLGKKAVGLPFEWKPILESGVQGAVTGIGIGGTVGAVHKYGKAPTDPNVKAALDSNAESEAIRAAHEKRQQDKQQAQLDQIEAERDLLAEEQGAYNGPSPATPAGPPPEGVGKEGTDFVAGMDPTAKQEQDREKLMLGIVRHAAKMVHLQDRITAESDKVKRAKLVGEFQKRRAQRASMIAELESYPDTPLSRGQVVPAGEPTPGIPGQGGGVNLRPAPPAPWRAPLTTPTPAPALGTAQNTGYDLESAKALGVAQNQLVLLQQQIQSTSDPNVREQLVQQFRTGRKAVQNMHHQIQQGQQRPDPTKPIDAEFRVIHDGPARLTGPTAQEITGVETTPAGKLPKVAAVSTPEGRREGIAAAQQRRLAIAAAKQAKEAKGEVDKHVPVVQELDNRLGALQEKLGETRHAPTRAKLVGEFRELTKRRQQASERLNAAIAKRDAGQTQPALPGLEEAPQAREPDYDGLSRQLDRMMPGIGIDAMPVAPQDGTSPAEIGPIAEIFDKWVKRSQAAKAGHATRAAKKAQSPNDGGMQTEQPAEETGVTPPENLDQPVKVDGTPDNNPPPAPAPVPDLPAETGHTASAGAELAAIRTRMPSRKPPPATPPVAALGTPPAAGAATGPVATPAPAKAPLRGSPGPLAASPDPVEAERTKRNQPQTQTQFVQTAISMNEFKKQTEAQMPPASPAEIDAVLQKAGAERTTPRKFFQAITTGDYQNAGLIDEGGAFWLLPRGYGHGRFRDEIGNRHPYVEISTAGTDSAGAGRPDNRPWTAMQRQRLAGLEADFKRLNGGVPSPYGTYIVIDDNNPAFQPAEVQLPDPNSPPWKVKEDNDPPSTGILEAALQLERQNPAKAEIAARAPRNVLARLLAKGPVNVDTALAHLQANLMVAKGSNLDQLLQRLRGAFPATTDRPSKVMIDNTALPGGYQGLYDPKTDMVHIDLQQAEDVLQALLHEIVHAAVATRLTNIGFQEQLLKLVNQAKQYWTDSGILPAVDEVYGFTNLNEFLSEALTNTDFQTKLKSLFDAEFDTRNAVSIWRKFKSRIATALGFQQKTGPRDLFDALLEFVPDGKFLTHANREASLAELDRLGLAEPQALMSTLNAVFRPKSAGPRDVLVSPRGRVMPKLMRKMSNYMINKSYAKFGRAFRDNSGRVVELGNWVERFFGLKDAMGGYAAAQQAKASQIVELFKNATYNDNEGRVGKIMERSRMYMLDASKAANHPANAAGMLRPGANAAYAELQEIWNDPAFTPAMKDTYELVRDHGDEIRYRQINDMMVEIVRQMVGETEANELQDYIVKRAPVESDTGKRHNIDLSYHPVMSAAEISTQMRKLVPNPALQAKAAAALKEVHSVIRQTPGPYFPLRRFGKFYVSLKSDQQVKVMSAAELDNMIAADRATGDGTIQVTGNTPVGGGRFKVTWRNEFYNEHENEKDALAERAKLIGEWKTTGRKFTLEDAKAGLKTDKSFERGGISVASIESLRKTLENALGGPASAGGKAASDAALQWFLERSPATSANKSRLQARNVAGASKDMLRAYAEYAYGTSFLQARIKYGPQLHRILNRDIPADVRTMQAGGNSRQGVDLAAIGEELKQRETLQMELAATDTDHGLIMKLWVKAPNIAASFYLTGIATMLVNSYQTIGMTIPELGKEFGFPSTTAALMGAYKDVFLRNVAATAFEVGRAGKYFLPMLKSIATGKPTPSFRDPMQSAVQQMTDHLPKGERDAMQALAEMRQLDFGLVADVQSVAFGNRGAGNLFTYLSEAAFILPQSIEAQNRVTTALATWRLHSKRMGLARGASVSEGTMTQEQFDQLVKVTVDKVKTTQIDYARDNKAPMMQKEGLRAALVFQNYAMQQLYTITHNFMQMFRAETPQGRAEAIRFLGAWGATTIAVAGVAGIIKIEPIYLMLVALMWGLGSEEEDPEALLRTSMANWNDDLRNLVLKGVPYSKFGVDTSRMGYSPVVPVDEMWKLYQNPNSGQKDWYSMIGKTLGGAPTDMIFKSVFGAASKAVVDGDLGKAAEMLTPKAFGINDAIRAYNYANSGVTTQYGNTVVDKDKITTKDIIVRGLGFTPSRIAEKQAQRHEGAFKTSVVRERKYELLDRYAKAALTGGKLEPIIQEIIQFNKKNPFDALTKKSMVGAVKRRATGAAMLETYGTEVRSKGDIYRAQEIAPKYGTGELEGAQQLSENPNLEGTDPSMLGIAANIETMKNLNLQLGRSGKQSDNIQDIRAETKDISNIKTMDEAADRLRQLGTSEKDVEFNISEARRRTRTEPGAVLIIKDILLDELSLAMGRDNYNSIPLEERPGRLGAPFLTRRKGAKPVPQDKPKYYKGATPR